MSFKITELTFLKYFAERYGIPAPRFISGNIETSVLKKALDDWGRAGLVKPDIITTGRGKAGAVVEVKNSHDALREIKRVSGLEIKGKMPRTAYMVEKIPAVIEMYVSITYSTAFLGPVVTVSLKGGMDVESIPDNEKSTIPIDIFCRTRCVSGIGYTGSFKMSQRINKSGFTYNGILLGPFYIYGNGICRN